MSKFANLIPHFLFLCDHERIPDLEATGEIDQYTCRFVHTVENMLASCLGEPPLAVFVDLPVLSRFESALVDAILHLGVSWPVMRLSTHNNNSHSVMCLQPRHSMALGQAMYEIAADTPHWRNPIYDRSQLRMDVQCRVQLRSTNDTTWYPGNTLDIGVRGAFVVTYDQWIEGEDIELELLDIVDEPIKLRARIVRVRSWNSTHEMPGVGIEFASATIPQSLIDAISKPQYINSLNRQLTAVTPMH